MNSRFLVGLGLLFLASCGVLKAPHLATESETPSQASFTEVSRLIIIEASVNGVSGKFLFDNGFSQSALNRDFAAKAGVAFKGKTQVIDANGKRDAVGKAKVKEVSINGHQFLNTPFHTIDTKKFFPCDEVDGVIGASIINLANWQIDFDAQTIKTWTKPFKASGTPLHISYSNNQSSFVKLSFEKQLVSCKIDLGMAGAVKLRSKDFAQLYQGKLVEQTVGITSISAHGLGKQDTVYELKTPVQIQHQDKELPRPGTLSLVKRLKYEGYVGLAYFRGYLLTINSSNRRYVLSAPKPIETELKGSYGLTPYQVKGIWRVLSINPADTLTHGIEVMDEIELLDGASLDRFPSNCELQAYLSAQKKNGKPLTLKIKGKDETFKIPYDPTTFIPLN